MYENNTKHVYLIGSITNEKYIGYTYEKEEAIEYVKRRKGLSYVKVKASEFDTDSRYGEELVRCYNNLMIATDEEYLLLGFAQYQIDVTTRIESFFRLIQYIRFTKSEEKIIEYVMGFLMKYVLAKKHGIIDENEENLFDEDDIFDYNMVVNWFIKNVGG